MPPMAPPWNSQPSVRRTAGGRSLESVAAGRAPGISKADAACRIWRRVGAGRRLDRRFSSLIPENFFKYRQHRVVLSFLQVLNSSQLLPNGSQIRLRGATRSSVESRGTANSEQARLAGDPLLGSETFSRSEQLRSFLSYVCRRALSGHGKEINEYSVAVDAV